GGEDEDPVVQVEHYSFPVVEGEPLLYVPNDSPREDVASSTAPSTKAARTKKRT
ncbi:unnamed protein product, partial [Amoebophrya sp. A25]